MFVDGAVDPEWPEYDDFLELAEDVERSVPSGVVKQLKAAASTPAPMSLSRVLEEYLTYKADEDTSGLRTRIDRMPAIWWRNGAMTSTTTARIQASLA